MLLRSYAHFITIAKEIGLLENDMLELKDMLTEWKRTPGLLGGTGGAGGAGGAENDLFGGYEVGKAAGSGLNVCECRGGLVEFRTGDSIPGADHAMLCDCPRRV